MNLLSYLLALTFAVLWLCARAAIYRCRKCNHDLTDCQKTLMNSNIQLNRMIAKLRGQLRPVWRPPVHIVGPSRIVEAFNSINAMPVRRFGGNYTEDKE